MGATPRRTPRCGTTTWHNFPDCSAELKQPNWLLLVRTLPKVVTRCQSASNLVPLGNVVATRHGTCVPWFTMTRHRSKLWSSSRSVIGMDIRLLGVAPLLLMWFMGCGGESNSGGGSGGTSGTSGGASGFGGERAAGGNTPITTTSRGGASGFGGERAAGGNTPITTTSRGGASGFGGERASGGSTSTSTLSNACGCLSGAYQPVCGTNGTTYDATCGDVCVPVAIACRNACPCGTGGTTGQGTGTVTGKGAGETCGGNSECGSGLLCCYPCGIAGCVNRCIAPTSAGVCPLYP